MLAILLCNSWGLAPPSSASTLPERRKAGFDFVVEAGLGRGHQDFRALLLHTLPGKRRAAEIWRDDGRQNNPPEEAAAYRRLLAEGTLDQCGVTLLAGKAVGAPFVGAAAAALVLAESCGCCTEAGSIGLST